MLQTMPQAAARGRGTTHRDTRVETSGVNGAQRLINAKLGATPPIGRIRWRAACLEIAGRSHQSKGTTAIGGLPFRQWPAGHRSDVEPEQSGRSSVVEFDAGCGAWVDLERVDATPPVDDRVEAAQAAQAGRGSDTLSSVDQGRSPGGAGIETTRHTAEAEGHLLRRAAPLPVEPERHDTSGVGTKKQ